MNLRSSFAAERRAHPGLWRAVALSACAALGTALPDIIDLVRSIG